MAVFLSPALAQQAAGQKQPVVKDYYQRSLQTYEFRKAAQSGPDFASQVNWWVRRIYLVLIFATIGGMLFHNGLLFYKKVSAHLRAAGRPVLRMSLAQRWQHAVLAGSFIVLALSGASWVARRPCPRASRQDPPGF